MTSPFADHEKASEFAERLKVYAHPQRLMILSCLSEGERRVSELAELTGIRQPALSQQLAELRHAELVCARKESKQVWYALADESVERCMRNLKALFGEGRQITEPAATSKLNANENPRAGTAAFAEVLSRQ